MYMGCPETYFGCVSRSVPIYGHGARNSPPTPYIQKPSLYVIIIKYDTLCIVVVGIIIRRY
jgi:hypothetical protein